MKNPSEKFNKEIAWQYRN